MNIDDKVELSRIQACIVPDSLTKVLETFRLPHHTLYVKKGMAPGLRETKFHPERGATAECGLEEKESPLQLSRGYGCGCRTLPRLTLYITTCSLDGRRKRSRRSKDVLAIVYITLAVLRSLILYGRLYSGA